MEKKRILIVDDEPDITELIAYNLKKEGYETIITLTGDEVLPVIEKEKPHLVLLDLMLPGMDGLEICRLLKKNPTTERIPIIMVTAKGETTDRIVGLELGADDYLTKPFHVKELVARIKAVFRRVEREREETKDKISIPGLELDLLACEVSVRGNKIALSAKEFLLLKFFMLHPNRVFSREQLLGHIWQEEAFVEPRTVDVHISRLRAAIEEDKENPRYILTVRGLGYKFSLPR